MPYPSAVLLSAPGGANCATFAAMRQGSSSNPATSDAIESIIVRLNACVAAGVIVDTLNSCTNLTILRDVSSIGPLPPNRLAVFLYPGPVNGLTSPGARMEPGAGSQRCGAPALPCAAAGAD